MTRNHEAFISLLLLGFDIKNIRQALPKLTAHKQFVVAKQIGISRPVLTSHLSGLSKWPQVQDKIAAFFGIPAEEFFADVRTKEHEDRPY